MKLTNVNLLAKLQSPEYAELLAAFTERSYPQGALIYSPGDPEDKVFIVLSGRVRIYMASDDKEFTLALLERGDLFSTHTRAYVQAQDPCTLLLMDTATFQRQLNSDADLSRAMINVLGGLLKNSFSIISGLVFGDAARRLAGYLAAETRAMQAAGRCDENGCLVRLDLTMDEVAKIVGTSRQTASMLLNDLIRSGDVQRVGRGAFLVPDPAKLEERLR